MIHMYARVRRRQNTFRKFYLRVVTNSGVTAATGGEGRSTATTGNNGSSPSLPSAAALQEIIACKPDDPPKPPRKKKSIFATFSEEKRQEAMRIMRWSHAIWTVIIPTLAESAPRSDFEMAVATDVMGVSDDRSGAIRPAVPNFPRCCSDALAAMNLPQLVAIACAFFPLQRLVVKTLDRMEEIAVAAHIEIAARREAFDVACLGGDPRLVQAMWSRARREYEDDDSAISDCCPTGMALACSVSDRPAFPYWFAEWFQLKTEDLAEQLPNIRFQACKSGQSELVRWLGEVYPISAAERDAMLAEGWLALVECCRRGHLEAAKEFVDSVPDGMVYSHKAVGDGLLAACENGRADVVNWIFNRFCTQHFQTRRAATVAAKGPNPAIASLICRLRKVPRRIIMSDDWFIVRAQWYAADLQTLQWFVDKYRICACELCAIEVLVVARDPKKGAGDAQRADALRNIYTAVHPAECSPWSYGCPKFQNSECDERQRRGSPSLPSSGEGEGDSDGGEIVLSRSSAKRRRLY